MRIHTGKAFEGSYLKHQNYKLAMSLSARKSERLRQK